MCLKVKVEHFLYFCHSFLIAQGKNKCIGNDVTGLLKNEITYNIEEKQEVILEQKVF